MDIIDFVNELRTLNIRLSAAGDQLRIAAPNGVLHADLRARLVERKQELLKFLADATVAAPAEERIRPRPAGEPIPASFPQQRLWLIDQMGSGGLAYVAPVVVRIDGPLDVRVWARSLNEVMRRHNSLRTTLATVDGEVVQVVAPPQAVLVPVVDLENLDTDEREVEARRIILRELDVPFDLQRGPLARPRLLRFNAREYVMLLILHHIISDGWTIRVLAKEMSEIYTSLMQKRPSRLPQLPVQYGDFAYWQRQRMRGDLLKRELAYWRSVLADAPELELPTDHPRPAVERFRGAERRFLIPATVAGRLRAIARDERVTLFDVLLAVFKALLCRYSGQDDIVLGTVVANRNRTELEGLIGFFINTLVLRTDLKDNPTFRELIARVHQVTTGAYTHQDLPFEKVVEELHPKRRLDRNPIFQVLVLLQNMPFPPIEMPNLMLRPWDIENGAPFDLLLSFDDNDEVILGALRYNTDLFEPNTVERLLAHFSNLVHSAATDPLQRIWAPPLMGPGECTRLMRLITPASSPRTSNRCLHELFTAHARRIPHAIAVVEGERHLTFGHLEKRADHLAERLRKCQLTSGAAVAIQIDRSAELVVAILGTLKAGLVCLHNSADAVGQIDRIASEANVAASLRINAAIPTRPSALSSADVSLEGEIAIELAAPKQPSPAGDDVQNSNADLRPENLAHVVYSADFVRKPFGVCLSHANLTRLFEAASRDFEYGLGRTWTLCHPRGSDVLLWEMWGALLEGGRASIVPSAALSSSDALWEFISRQKVMVLSLPTESFILLVGAVTAVACSPPSLSLVVLHGATDVHESVAKWISHFGETNPRLIRASGWAETSVHIALHRLTKQDATPTVGYPMGIPVSDASLHLVDPFGQPVPIGVPGELLVGGPGVSLGYLGKPALTAQRFVPDPFGRSPGARLFRAGRLAKRLENGVLIDLSQRQRTLPSPGQPIEFAEIESALLRHPMVEQAAITLRDGLDGRTQIVAYLVITDPHMDAASLRAYFARVLPAPLLPSCIVVVPALPRTASGAVAFDQLPAPAAEFLEHVPDAVLPRTSLEMIVSKVWAEVLHRDSIERDENFFDLGGHSLLAMELLNRLRELTGVDLSFRDLFEEPTVRRMARTIESLKSGARAASPQPELTRIVRDDYVKHPVFPAATTDGPN